MERANQLNSMKIDEISFARVNGRVLPILGRVRERKREE